jgi:hypothetical protein
MANPPTPANPNPPAERPDTVLETDEDIRRAIQAAAVKSGPPGTAHQPGQGAPSAPPPGRAASPFRPTLRPPVAILTVFDDGRIDGESIRLRDDRFTIGRTEGDLRIPIDSRISAKHVAITHQVVGGIHRWVVTDLQSTHGLFVRVSRTVLADKAEFLVGNGRYQFEGSQADGSETAAYSAGELTTGETRGWVEGAGTFRPPAVTELLGKEIGNRLLLAKKEYWIGSDPACAICRPDDPFCEAWHARLHVGSKGKWQVEHNKTQNGLWLRMPQINVEAMVQFQIGEQRFQLKIR